MQSDSSNVTYLLVGLLIAACLLGGGVYYWKHTRPAAMPSTAEGAASSTTTYLPGGIVVSGNATVRESDTPVSNIPAPEHAAPLTLSSSVSADVVKALNAQYAQIQSILAKDPTNFAAWIDLGIVRKTGGDYTGAAADWTYVSKIYPTSGVAFDDLGDLYMNFIKDYPQAELVLKQAVALNPHDVSAYENLFALYTSYGYKGASAGVSIMNEAIAANPTSPDLHVLFARYYRSAGDAADAKVQYDAAISLADKQGNTDLVAALKQEESAN